MYNIKIANLQFNNCAGKHLECEKVNKYGIAFEWDSDVIDY